MWDLSSPTRDRTCVPCIGRRILNHWTAREVPAFGFLNLLPCEGSRGALDRERCPLRTLTPRSALFNRSMYWPVRRSATVESKFGLLSFVPLTSPEHRTGYSRPLVQKHLLSGVKLTMVPALLHRPVSPPQDSWRRRCDKMLQGRE